MVTIKIWAEYSYQILDDSGKILESNSGFDDVNECLQEAIDHGEDYDTSTI